MQVQASETSVLSAPAVGKKKWAKPPTHKRPLKQRLGMVWKAMMARMLRDQRVVHVPWQDLNTFRAEIEKWAGPMPSGPGWTLGRIDNDRGYEPGNVKWEQKNGPEQQRNKKKMAIVKFNGKDRLLVELWESHRCAANGITYSRLWHRHFNEGFSVHDALTRPPAKRNMPVKRQDGLTDTFTAFCSAWGVNRTAVSTYMCVNRPELGRYPHTIHEAINHKSKLWNKRLTPEAYAMIIDKSLIAPHAVPLCHLSP